MHVEKKYCVNHPERLAIGICVITEKPLCAECSTRYDGVNYSREGLEILRQRRLGKRKASRVGLPALIVAGCVMSVLAFFAYMLLGRVLMGML